MIMTITVPGEYRINSYVQPRMFVLLGRAKIVIIIIITVIIIIIITVLDLQPVAPITVRICKVPE